MKRSVIGVLAHVDAGKTTLSEAMLYLAGSIRSLGRVDHGDAFLDTFAMERQRGITIFSKQAVFRWGEREFTLLDTPGHVDFSPEMERTLAVLDAAVLVVSGTDGIQSHTMTVWKLLRKHKIPTFLFVNKMDLSGPGREELMRLLRRDLGESVWDVRGEDEETAAVTDERLLEEYLQSGRLDPDRLSAAIAGGALIPCWFGAALKLEGVEDLLQGLHAWAPGLEEGGAFGARIYKITRDADGVRLSHLKVTGGTLRVRETLEGEKITALRIYSGAKYRAVEEVLPGQVAAVAGLSKSYPGEGLGRSAEAAAPTLEPVLRYELILPPAYDKQLALRQLRQLEEEEPSLRVDWDPRLSELSLHLMGPIQLEILRDLLRERFGMEAEFGPGSILYRETIAAPVEGVGHYEPLRHYAEVHLLLEPAARGSGITIASSCPEDDLARSWQRLILTHIGEKQHLGVLTGSPLTDVSITLLSGRAHLKHTEGGDFREATYRAIRQGLMKAQSILLEPWYDFVLELPAQQMGRAMTDLDRMGARCEPAEILGEEARILGAAPVAAIRDYPQELVAYTRGRGRMSVTPRGYEPCKEQDAVAAALGYDPESDLENSPDSVFCSHGAGHTVKWNEVEARMHLPNAYYEPQEEPEEPEPRQVRRYAERVAGDKELMQIFERTYGPIKSRSPQRQDSRPAPRREPSPYKAAPRPQGPEYLLVDGYNVIFAWEELRELARDSLDHARTRLCDRLRNYQGYCQHPVIVVFDAYKVQGGRGSLEQYGDFSVVYTREAETADMYIEKVTARLGEKHRVRVVTSDGLEQIIILNHGCLRVPALSFEKELSAVEKAISESLRTL